MRGTGRAVFAATLLWSSLGIFFLCLYIIHGIFIYGDDEQVAGT
jgi:hypothetical protein